VLTLQVAGLHGVPYNAGAAMVGVTVVSTGLGYLTVYPSDQVKPYVSNLNYTPNQTVPNQAAGSLSTTGNPPGRLSFYNQAGASQDVVDLFGFFAP
jgi:hypothetical protein